MFHIHSSGVLHSLYPFGTSIVDCPTLHLLLPLHDNVHLLSAGIVLIFCIAFLVPEMMFHCMHNAAAPQASTIISHLLHSLAPHTLAPSAQFPTVQILCAQLCTIPVHVL